jgi:hypothetical protein
MKRSIIGNLGIIKEKTQNDRKNLVKLAKIAPKNERFKVRNLFKNTAIERTMI